MSQPDVPDLESLPYAIRAYVEAKKIDADLLHSLAEQERKEVDSLSRDERDWHGPGERSEAIGRIRWRYKSSSDLKGVANICVEAEVARLAEVFMPSAILSLNPGEPFSCATGKAFWMAEQFLDERDRRALAIRTANVDGLLGSGSN